MDTQNLRDALLARLKQNYEDYQDSFLQLDRQELIDRAERIAETTHVYKFLTEEHQFKETEPEYLIQF